MRIQRAIMHHFLEILEDQHHHISNMEEEYWRYDYVVELKPTRWIYERGEVYCRYISVKELGDPDANLEDYTGNIVLTMVFYKDHLVLHSCCGEEVFLFANPDFPYPVEESVICALALHKT